MSALNVYLKYSSSPVTANIIEFTVCLLCRHAVKGVKGAVSLTEPLEHAIG